jgi:hypothetical protein
MESHRLVRTPTPSSSHFFFRSPKKEDVVKHRFFFLLVVAFALIAAGMSITADAANVVEHGSITTNQAIVVFDPGEFATSSIVEKFAPPSAEDPGGGTTWSCTDTDAANGKVVYGIGFTDLGYRYYLCDHEGWTWDTLGWFSNGARYWSCCAFYHNASTTAWRLL